MSLGDIGGPARLDICGADLQRHSHIMGKPGCEEEEQGAS